MTSFLGRYEYQLDQKGRVSLPSAFRREVEGDRFVLLQWRPPALTLFPKPAWAQAQERLLSFRRNQPEAWTDVLGHRGERCRGHAPTSRDASSFRRGLQEAAEPRGERVLLVGNIDRDRTLESGCASPRWFERGRANSRSSRTRSSGDPWH